jgi:hypothetical protein
MASFVRQIGTRYTPLQVVRMVLRARRFAILKEDLEVDAWRAKIRG